MSRLDLLAGPTFILTSALVGLVACRPHEHVDVDPEIDAVTASSGDAAAQAGPADGAPAERGSLESTAMASGGAAPEAVAPETVAEEPVAEEPAAQPIAADDMVRPAPRGGRRLASPVGERVARDAGRVGRARPPASRPWSSGGGAPVRPSQTEPVTMYGTSETYTDHGVNPFTMVADDALSTFSVDVDTASFAIARRKIEAGVLPPPEAVRVEEFVNYFDYGYQPPTDDEAFAVHMDAMPDPFRAGHHLLRVGVQAVEVRADERPPLHLTFLVDVSGSMSRADKLDLAKSSLHMLVDSLQEDDTVALATYAGRTARILAPTPAEDKRVIHAAIEGLESGGSTAMSSGLELAYGMAWDSFVPGHENRVIVLSDGDANVGRTSWDEMLSEIQGYADRGVTMSTIGFGMGNYQDTLMEQLANKGDGNNYYIDDEAQARRVFVEDLGGTLVTVARDVKIQVEFNPDAVLAYRLIGYENRDIADRDFRDDKVDAGEVGSGHNVTALYDVILAEGYDRDLATVRLRYERPGADVDQGGSGGIERAFTFRDGELAELPEMAGRDLRVAYTAASFAEILRHSPEAQEMSLDALIAFGERAKRPGEPDDAELLALMRRARDLGAGTSGGAVSRR